MAGPCATQLLASLAGEIDRVLGTALGTGRRVGIVGFPNHRNVGDSAIWLGEERWLARNGHRIAYQCDDWTYSRGELAARVGDGPILLHGGGNLGDLYPGSQLLRERVVRDFPDNQIVQLPQTVTFLRAAAADRAREVLGAHRDLTVLVRDHASVRAVRERLGLDAGLCPDMAFALGPLAPPARRGEHVVWLARTDGEAAGPRPAAGRPDVRVVDWLDPSPRDPRWRATHRATNLTARKLGWVARRAPAVVRRGLPRVWALERRQAGVRLEDGRRLLGGGRAVITDRLHGHILAALLGVPHVLLEDRHGKLAGFHETWTCMLPGVRVANTHAEALRAADELDQSRLPRP